LATSLRAQETHLVDYAGFAGFQAPVWAPKDLGLFAKYGFNGDVVLVQRNLSVKVDLNVNRYLDESTVDELERGGFFKRLAGKS
jgi:hypothetical protein